MSGRGSALLVAILFGLLPYAVADTARTTYGFGMGSLYGGLGANIGWMRDGSLYHLSLGCPAIGYGSNEGWLYQCGVGAGAYTTRWLTQAGEHHALGVYLGALIDDTDVNGSSSRRQVLGLGYLYFREGISSAGWNLGAMPVVERSEGDSRGGLYLQLGYQY